MNCPFCEHTETKVIDKRTSEAKTNRRRRECLKCHKRFTTYEKVDNLLAKVRKRDGKEVDFDQIKIMNAIWKAAQSVGGTDRDMAKALSDKVVAVLEEKFGGTTIPTVEQIQDIVEKVLVENGHYKTAKAYILYRKQHEKIRETKTLMVDVNNTIGEYLNQTDWIKVEVTAVNDKNVTLHVIGQFKNGTTPTPMDMTVNVQTGNANSSEAFGVGGFGSFLLLAGNLSAGDNVITSSSETLKINETTTRTYLGASRTVNIINFTMQQEAFGVEYLVVYDQASGVLLEADISENIPYYGTMQVSLSATETNIFATGTMGWLQDNMFYVIIAIVFIILIIIAGVAFSRRRKPPATQPPTQTTPTTTTQSAYKT